MSSLLPTLARLRIENMKTGFCVRQLCIERLETEHMIIIRLLEHIHCSEKRLECCEEYLIYTGTAESVPTTILKRGGIRD